MKETEEEVIQEEFDILHSNHSQERHRLNEILDMIGRLAALDFSSRLEESPNHDTIDAIALGLNMLSEELQSNVVEKQELDVVNKKLEKFAFVTAHDLKSPLNTISGLVSLIEMSVGKNTEVQPYLEIIRDRIERMKNLIIGVLDYSRNVVSKIDREHLDLNELLEDLIQEYDFDNEACITVPEKLPFLFYNRTYLIQIFQNLISNAIKYSEKERCKINIGCQECGDYFKISVADDGPGIPEEFQENIFELFYKIERGVTKDSHGIGLHTIKSIVESEGGKIWVSSVAGMGSTFFFTVKK